MKVYCKIVFEWINRHNLFILLTVIRGFPVDTVMNSLQPRQEMEEMWVLSPGWKDPLE